MRIAVAGGTGTVGSPTVERLRAGGHEVVVLSRATGIDLVAGDGLDEALRGVDTVIDAASVQSLNEDKAIAFFTAATGNLVTAAAEAGVAHVVLLSIVGIDRNPHDYYAGKIVQEKIVMRSPVPWTILRATQFHEFAGQILRRAGVGPFRIAPTRTPVQPIAADEVAARLVSLVTGTPQGRVRDLAGPRPEELGAMMRAVARADGHRGWIPSIPIPTKQMAGMRAGSALPGPDAELGVQTFAEWLAAR